MKKVKGTFAPIEGVRLHDIVNTPGRETPLLPAVSTHHGALFGHKEPLPARERLPAEVPAGLGPGIINGTAPLRDAGAVRGLLPQVPAGGVGKKVSSRFFQPPLAEIVELVGFALFDGDKGEPAAARAAPAAGSGFPEDLAGIILIHVPEGKKKVEGVGVVVREGFFL